MDKLTFIFIGRGGSGKGTQAVLLNEYLAKQDPTTPVFYLETGAKFRQFIAGDTYSSHLSKAVMEQGERQPDFLAVWTWSTVLVEGLTGNEHLVFDGTPRSMLEAEVLDTALNYYHREKRYIVYLDIPEEISLERLKARGRADDEHLAITKKRFEWFNQEVAHAIEYYQSNPKLYTFLHIDGTKSVDEVHQEIISHL